MARSIDTHGRSLRQHTARGTIVNAAFLVAITTLGLVRGFVVAAFLTRSDYGIWGILLIGLGTLTWLKGSAVSDKYVQQDEADQEVAFQKAFTLELIFITGLIVLVLIALPLLALVYGQPKILAPGIVAAFVLLPAIALQSPLWFFYRQMEFAKQRSLQAVDPVTSFIVTVALAVAGLGYWALLLGTIAGSAAAAAAAVGALPYRLELNYDPKAAKEYFRFSWPIFVSGLAGLIVAQSSLIVGNAVLGIGAVGVITLASSVVSYTDNLDEIVTTTLYPAICAVKDRTDLLFESFVKSNRIALMWGMPFGAGLALFAPDLVRFGIGHRWQPAVPLIQILGIVAASHQIGFNWTAFYRARGDTKPLAIVNAIVTVAFVAAVIPLTIADGLDGFGIAMAVAAVVAIAARGHYLVKLFPGLAMVRHGLRAIAPTVPAAAAVLLLRALESGARSRGDVVVEFTLYVAVTVLATYAFERPLLRELTGYLRAQTT
jgi:PST family polysaccharide transporter